MIPLAPLSYPARLGARWRRFFSRSNRVVLSELVRANLKASDYHSIFGGLSSLAGSAAMLAALYYVFGRHFGAAMRGYPLYLLVGIVPLNFFVTASHNLLKVLVINRDIALNSTIPRESLVLGAISFTVWKLGVEMLICAVVSVAGGFFSWRGALLLVPLLFLFVGLVLGIGLLLSLLFCLARDIDHLWTVVSRLLLFATPVFYTLASLSPSARWIITWVNPLTPFLGAFRAAFMQGGRIAPPEMLHCLLLGAGTLAVGYLAFVRFEGTALDRT